MARVGSEKGVRLTQRPPMIDFRLDGYYFLVNREVDMSEDEVNEPTHYNQNGIEVIEVIETYAKTDFRLANVIKYVCRCEYKGNKLQDLKKAQWYLNRCVQELEAAEHHEFVSSLASRIAGEDETAQKIKDEYYKFDRYEIQGYCAYCDAEIAKGQPYIRNGAFDKSVMFCSQGCVDKMLDWQGR